MPEKSESHPSFWQITEVDRNEFKPLFSWWWLCILISYCLVSSLISHAWPHCLIVINLLIGWPETLAPTWKSHINAWQLCWKSTYTNNIFQPVAANLTGQETSTLSLRGKKINFICFVWCWHKKWLHVHCRHLLSPCPCSVHLFQKINE